MRFVLAFLILLGAGVVQPAAANPDFDLGPAVAAKAPDIGHLMDQNNKSQESEPERHDQNYSRRADELIEAHLDNAGIGIIARQRRVL